MELQLTDKVAIVTGASRGIGRAIAKELANEGMRLVLVARSEEGLRETASLCGNDCFVQPVDLHDARLPEAVVAAAVQRFGRLDLLVNNAGATKRGDFLALTETDWSDGFSLKFFGAMRMCRAAWPHLKTAHGSIINIAGIGGRTGTAEFTIGGSVNAAVLNLTKALADRGVADAVRVNAINPSSVLTDRLDARISKIAAAKGIGLSEASRQMTEKLGVSRFGKPEEIAAMVAFLASPVSAYCHGSIIDIDGGKTRTL